MQLHILDRDPGRAVRFLADVHVIKMCLETMQIVAGVIHNFHLPPVPGMLKPYNPSHPVIRAVDSPAKTQLGAALQLGSAMRISVALQKKAWLF